jgi:hypothetical protein
MAAVVLESLELADLLGQTARDPSGQHGLEGIAAAKAGWVYKGRTPTIDAGMVRKLGAEGVGGTEIARRLGIARASVYRLLRN